ncbi:MAG: type I-F CRISPR-associated helicase Cas3f [Gammaproteobacteria bacterium]
MIVFFVSECEKKAFTRSRRVLNKYALQLGRRTWQARLSEEGLRDIYLELRESATRQTSVACHRVLGHNKTALVWVVGNRLHFNDEGWFSFSQTRRDIVRAEHELPANCRLLSHLLSLAALCHDLGKANAFFQNKLVSGAIIRDPYRHEFVSCLILAQVIAELKPVDDSAWLACFSQPDSLQTAFAKVLNRDDWFDVDILPHQISFWKHLKSKGFQSLPLFSSLLWLVLTHHKLPDGSFVNERIGFDLDQGFFGSNEKIDKQQSITFSPNKNMPWQDSGWIESVAKKTGELCYLLQEQSPSLVQPSQADDLKIAIAHIARPFLVLGDYQASKNKQLYPKSKDTRKICFANTLENQPADPLELHLHKVERQTNRCFRVLMAYQENMDFQTITEDRLSPILSQKRKLDQCLPEFRWQEDCCQRIRKEHGNCIQDGGFFGILAAKTGAGKTLAAARVMSALSKELRFSLALGLRSLTLQAGDDYKNQLGFKQSDIAVMVGSKTSQALFDYRQAVEAEHDKQDTARDGTFNEGIADEDEVMFGDSGSLGESFPALNEKELTLLATAVLISTVDHIISPADGRRSKSTLMSLRLMTSDLVLDEVDSYSASDLVALGKLVYLAGLYGRKVLLVSATLPPGIAVSFYRAYQAGFKHYLLMKAIERPIFCGWFSDQYQFSQLTRCKNIDQYEKNHALFSGLVAQQLSDQPAKRPAELLDINACLHEEALFEQVLQRCFSLHRHHHVIDDDTNARVSIGLVRWNNTKPCVGFSRHLLRREADSNDLPFKLVCYHAKLLPIVLHDIETFCQQALKRQTDKLTEHPMVKRALGQSQDLVIIIVATSIIEVGRDFDFDWGVFEPQSTRSIIQTAGRILRHREKTVALPNVALLSTTYRGLFKSDTPGYCYPGVETPTNRYRCELSSTQVVDLFDFASMQQGINAQWSLLVPEESLAEISFQEHRSLIPYLEQDEDGRDLKYWLENAESHLHGYHSQENIFRKGLYREGQYLFRKLDIDEGQITLSPNWQWRSDNQICDYSVHELDLCNRDRLLLVTDVEKSLGELKRSGQFEVSLLEKLVAIELDFIKGTPKFSYHHALGLIQQE